MQNRLATCFYLCFHTFDFELLQKGKNKNETMTYGYDYNKFKKGELD